MLRFVGTEADPTSRIIRTGEMGFWASHVECQLPDGRLLGAHSKGGVQARAADYDADTWTSQLFVRVPCTNLQADSLAGLVARIGTPYDFTAIIEMALGLASGSVVDWGLSSNNVVCSALMEIQLLASGIIMSAPMDAHLMDPRDVLVQVSAIATIGTPETRVLPQRSDKPTP